MQAFLSPNPVHRRRAQTHPTNRHVDPRMCVASPRRVLLLGGSGRVGVETAAALIARTTRPLAVTLAARNANRAAHVLDRLRRVPGRHVQQTSVQFLRLDLRRVEDHALLQAVAQHDLVVHTAGPFQRRPSPTRILRACMRARVPYMDVCDDPAHAHACKLLHCNAMQDAYTAFISTGIYPGVSNLMAAHVARIVGDADSLKLFYHTAGSGGIGATVLASTFLILSERALCYDASGEQVWKPPAGEPERVDFKGAIGERTTYLLNLPEVVSLHDCLFDAKKVQIYAKFSTAPPVWNWLLQFMAKWGPRELMADANAMLAFSKFSMPIVKAVDLLSGARTGMKVVAKKGDQTATFLYQHDRLDQCVGQATAAFALELLRDDAKSLPSGIWYPEELDADVRARILRDATASAEFCYVE